jgi:hypothetical protein
MVDELDIYRTAQLLVNQHGTDAPVYAAMRQDQLSASGDVEGAHVWKRVLAAIDVLLVQNRDVSRSLQ